MPSRSSGSWTGVAHDLATDANRVGLVHREVVGESGAARVHVGAAERFVIRLLAGGHPDQRRPGEEDLGVLGDHHHVVAHTGDVRPAGGRIAEYERDRRDPCRGQAGEVAEQLSARDEDLFLRRQISTARLDQPDDRQSVLERDLVRAQHLLQRVGIRRAAAHGRVGAVDHALDAVHHADAGDDRGADRVVGAPCRER
jgi:hypothetical protein